MRNSSIRAASGKGKKRMFKLQRLSKHSASSPTSTKSKSGEKFDFNFSDFQALQVPKGWDKLYVSIISVETGKTIAKSNKAPVRNGTCQWTETLSESLWISQDDSSKELEEYLIKIVISMGSARSGILGESIVNMARYKSSRASAPVSLLLKKCNYGTILQVNIHCLTQITKLRDEEPTYSNSHAELREEDHHDTGSKSNETEESLAMSLRSQSSQELGSKSHPKNLESTETSNRASGSNHSFASGEDSVRRENLSPPRDLNGDKYNLGGRQDAGQKNCQKNSPDGIYPADDPFISNHSSFNSRITHSEDNSRDYEEEYGQSSSLLITTSSLTNADSSKNLLEAAEDTIEELRDEAKMWERDSQRLALDLDILKEKYSYQSKKLTNVEMELSAARTEQDGMKKELEQLRLLLDESIIKQTNNKDSPFHSEGVIHIQRELENEIKFQKEANAYLAMQLEKSQDSNIEFVSVLQDLEETIEKQKVDIKDLSKLQERFNGLEDSIQGNLDENRFLFLQVQQLQESEKALLGNIRLLEQALEAQKTELENERGSYQKSLLDIEQEYKCKLSVSEEEIVNLNTKLAESLTGREIEKMGSSSVDLIKETEGLKEKVQELERDCSELTNENLELLCKLKELEKVIEEDKLAESKRSELYTELLKQLEMAFHHITRPWYNITFEENGKCESCYGNLVSMHRNDTIGSKDRGESLFNYFMELNKLLAARILKCEEVLKIGELEINARNKDIAEAREQMECFSSKVQELENSNVELEANLENLLKEMAAKRSETEMLEADLLSKEEQIEIFRQSQMELKIQASDIKKERDILQENMEIAIQESNITSKCLDDLRNDLMVLNCTVDSHVSANKLLQIKSSELETRKRELELRLFEVEEENMQLSECISGLEAQVKNVEEERKSSQLVLENSKFVANGLQEEIRRLTLDMEKEKVVLEEKLQDMENQLSEAQEECEYQKIAGQKSQASAERLVENCNTLEKLNGELRNQKMELDKNFKSVATGFQDEIRKLTVEMDMEKHVFQEKLQDMENQLSEAQEDCEFQKIANQKSQASAKSLTQNCISLQKLNGELRKQNLELHYQCTHLETKLRESEQSLSNSSKKIETLEERISSLREEFAAKEKFLTSELDVLLQENREQKEKLIQEESLLNQMYLEKTGEVENLQKEVEHLINQISATNDERDRIANEAVNEVSSLRSDRTKLEFALEEVSSRLKLTEDELDGVRTEYESRVQGLMAELSASKQSQADHEKVLKALSSYRSSRDKLKTSVSDLELKLTVSEYERQQLLEETAHLKAQFQKLARFQDDMLTLKSKLQESKLEKEKLEASLHLVTIDNEELKAENSSFAEKISSLQKAMSEFEDSKNKRIALEEKLLHMERDLTAKDALYQEDDELRDELSRMKRANKQYKRKVQQFEDEKDAFLKRAQSLEENLKLLEAEKVVTESGSHVESPHAVGVDYVAKIRLLENELAEALEANNKYKLQLQSIFSDGLHSHSATPKKSVSGSAVVAKGYERTKSSLETELIDLRDRYFQMSLQYAEVEAEREDLVMKLKTTKNGKRWLA